MNYYEYYIVYLFKMICYTRYILVRRMQTDTRVRLLYFLQINNY